MPFGVEVFGRALCKRSERGLYAGRTLLFGNKISEDGGNKSRRRWRPNVQQKKIFSDALGLLLPLRVTTGALRNIDKAGGLDRYLWKIEGTNEDTKKAEQLRQQLRDHEENKRLEQLAAEQAALAPPQISQPVAKPAPKKSKKYISTLQPKLMSDARPVA